jgi:hypothetical protein
MWRALHTVSLLTGLVSNLIPLYGVLFWQWDTFQLLMLYWTETAILAFWTLMRLSRLSAAQRGTVTVNGKVQPASTFFLVGFFALHAGMFLLGHLLFLWVIFSGEWLKTIHSVHDFFHGLFVANGIWAALILFFLTHWVAFLVHSKPVETAADGSKADPVAGIVLPLYGRIIIMQVAIIFGAWLANELGSLAPLLIVIALKTLGDLAVSARRPSTIEKMDFSKNKVSIEM